MFYFLIYFFEERRIFYNGKCKFNKFHCAVFTHASSFGAAMDYIEKHCLNPGTLYLTYNTYPNSIYKKHCGWINRKLNQKETENIETYINDQVLIGYSAYYRFTGFCELNSK